MKIILDKLQENLKIFILLDNKPGAGSTLGTDMAAKAPADGYTLVASYNSSISPGTLLYNKLPYDALKDFKHIALIGVFPQYMVVKGDYAVKNIQEFLALVKSKPGALNYSSAGVGTSGFLAVELLKQTLNLDLVHVPYKGTGPAMTDLLGGRLDMVMTSSAASLWRLEKSVSWLSPAINAILITLIRRPCLRFHRACTLYRGWVYPLLLKRQRLLCKNSRKKFLVC